MKIGLLTAGGDCPGLNAVIRGVVLKGDRIYDHEFVAENVAGLEELRAAVQPFAPEHVAARADISVDDLVWAARLRRSEAGPRDAGRGARDR